MAKKKRDISKIILLIFTVLSTTSTILLGWWGVIQKQKATTASTLSVQVERDYTDKNGVLVKEIENLTLKNNLHNQKIQLFDN